ncbi:class I SAM-dependent methyltransferase [Litoribacillus peritrichatus]|uniref:Methyltransferase domain-containing protein n=1 Tax=Litoribacillus peritrichatus TaxID=718191 RepID=A0ABP7N2P8_9GAMM
MSDSWDDYASEWDANKDAVLYADKAYQTLINVVNLKGLRVLDFGCGTGLLSERMAPLVDQIVALDPSPKMISALDAKQLPCVETLAAELTEELITSSSVFETPFDLVVASSVCSFLPDYEQTLLLLKRLLSDKGIFIQWDWLDLDGSGTGLTENRISTALDGAGFKRFKVSQPFSLTSDYGTMSVVMAAAGGI